MKTICLDIGHMNTTGAFPTALPEGGYKIERLAFEDKDLVLNSQLILTEDQMQRLAEHKHPSYDFLKELGPIRIGNKLPAYVENGEKFSYFKVAPKYFEEPYGTSKCARQAGITHGQLMSCYVFALMESVFRYNSDNWHESERGEIELLVGCPSTQDWVAESEKSKYETLVQQATKVRSVRIVPESRGAMFSGVEKKKEIFSAMNGAAVFDFGSSTADFTYMLMGRKVIEFSWTLGAGKIEEQMAMEAYLDLVQQRGNFVADEGSISAVVDLMRPAKEAYYDGRYTVECQSIVCKFKEYDNDGVKDGKKKKPRSVVIDVDDEFMDRITGEDQMEVLCDSREMAQGSWQDLCRAFYRAAREAIESAEYTGVDENGNSVRKRCEVHSIILTGGASRMSFIESLAREVFPDSDINIYMEENPSHTVSNGLAWVAVSDARLEDCRKAVLDQINANESSKIETLNKNLSDGVFKIVSEIVVREANAWANIQSDVSVRVLQNSLQSAIESEDVQNRFETVCVSAINDWKRELSAVMETAVNSQTKQLFTEEIAKGVAIPQDIWKELQAGSLDTAGLDVSAMMKSLDLNGFTRKLGKMILQIAIWAAALAGAIATGGIAIVIALIASIIADVATDDTDLDKLRSQTIRKKVANKMPGSVSKSKNDIMKDFNESLKLQADAYQEMIEKNVTAALEIATLKRFEL